MTLKHHESFNNINNKCILGVTISPNTIVNGPYQVAGTFFFFRKCPLHGNTLQNLQRKLVPDIVQGVRTKSTTKMCFRCRFCTQKHVSVVDFVCTPCIALYCVDFVHTTIEMYFRYCIGSSYKL